MNIKTKRTMAVILLFAGVAWNCLCLLRMIPLLYYALSALAVGGYSFAIIFLPLLFPALAKADGKSNCHSELTREEKQLSGVMLALIAAWVVSLAACIVYPL